MHTTSAFLLLAAALLPAAESPLLSNGDMSAGTAVPAGWDTTWQPEGLKPVTVHRDTTIFASAPASLRLENPGGVEFGNVSRHLPITPKITLTIGAKLRSGPGGPAASFVVQGTGTDGQQKIWQPVVTVDAGAATWVSGNTTVTVPEGLSDLALVLMTSATGAVWLDDVTVSK